MLEKTITKNNLFYIVACDYAITDQLGKVSALGIFDKIFINNKESEVVRNFYIVSRVDLINPNSTLKNKSLKIDIVEELENKLIGSVSVLLPDDIESKTYNLNFNFPPVVIEKNKNYISKVSFDNKVFSECSIFNTIN